MNLALTSNHVDISIVITTFNENEYLDSLLIEISAQKIRGLKIEILIVEAGDYTEDRARRFLGEMSSVLIFHRFPKISRTKALNYLFEHSKGELIVRLDGRSSVNEDYVNDIFLLSKKTNADVCGGVMVPKGNSSEQILIAKLMAHPFAFGGGSSRKIGYTGYTESVYLGAFKRLSLKMLKGDLFDQNHPQISEDSDLNFRIRRRGGSIFIDSSIQVKYYARENLSKFFRLCKNYGIARGLFIIKHRQPSAYRQLAPIVVVILGLIMFLLSLKLFIFRYIILSFLLCYTIILLTLTKNIKEGRNKVIFGFMGCHFYWIWGLIQSPYVYIKNLKELKK
jgi:succinoglycan biosynthesis protein ExoA